MSKRNETKRLYEKAVAERLFRALELPAVFLSHGDDKKEPDTIFQLDGKRVGVEVGTTYYTEEQARREWTLACKEREFPNEGFEDGLGETIVNPDDLLCGKAQAQIDEKCKKTYEGCESVWLCLELDCPLADRRSATECVTSIVVPKSHNFAAIYLTLFLPMHEGGQCEAFRVFPPGHSTRNR